MKKSLLLLIICISSLGSVQAQSTYEMNCTMIVDDILRVQPFDIDDAISENARYITQDLIGELIELYEKINAGDTNNLQGHFDTIDQLLIDADAINMNYSMFDEDLEFIETYK